MRIWLSKYQSSIHISLAHLCRGLKEQGDGEDGTATGATACKIIPPM